MPNATTLDAIAEVGLGFKSLQNDFYYLSAEAVKTFSIEKEFLRPIYMLDDFEARRYVQKVEPQVFVFTCTASEQELRGTGALRYIRTMAGKLANQKKQSGKQETIQDVLSKQGGRLWYAPKASRHSSQIWLRKAVGGVHAPILFPASVVVDQRCNYVVPQDGITFGELAAILTSTVFVYAAEVNGSTSMGAGALELPTTKLRGYPVPNVREWSPQARQLLVELANSVWGAEETLDWQKQPEPGAFTRALDTHVLQQLPGGIPVDRLYDDVRACASSRQKLAADKTGKQRKKESESIGTVAAGIAAQLRSKLEAQRFPACLYPPGTETEEFDLGTAPLERITAHPMMGLMEVSVKAATGADVLEVSLAEPSAALLLRSLLLGVRTVAVPVDASTAAKASSAAHEWVIDLSKRLDSLIEISAAGSGYEDQVRARTLDILGVHANGLDRELPQVAIFKPV